MSTAAAQAAAKKKKKLRRLMEAARLRGVKVRLEEIDYKNTALLNRLVTGQGKLLGRKRTGLSAECQRALSREIKRARFMALMPFVA
jgi:small subunit ribosomal protein S18